MRKSYNYLNAHKFANVETADLEKAMEDASGKDLKWFFDQWVYQAGFPRMSVRQVYNPRNKLLNLTVVQTQTGANVPSVFTMPLDIEVVSANGIKTETLDITKRVQNFTIKIGGKPLKINFDKDIKIPLKIIKIIPPTASGAKIKSRHYLVF